MSCSSGCFAPEDKLQHHFILVEMGGEPTEPGIEPPTVIVEQTVINRIINKEITINRTNIYKKIVNKYITNYISRTRFYEIIINHYDSSEEIDQILETLAYLVGNFEDLSSFETEVTRILNEIGTDNATQQTILEELRTKMGEVETRMDTLQNDVSASTSEQQILILLETVLEELQKPSLAVPTMAFDQYFPFIVAGGIVGALFIGYLMGRDK